MIPITPTTIRLCRVNPDASAAYLRFDATRVDYTPTKRYSVEKPNAFDPSFIHRRGPWFEHLVDATFILTAAEYSTLLSFLTAPGQLYIEFTYQGTGLLQFPVTCEALPPLPDDLREYTAETTARFRAAWADAPEFIDFDNVDRLFSFALSVPAPTDAVRLYLDEGDMASLSVRAAADAVRLYLDEGEMASLSVPAPTDPE